MKEYILAIGSDHRGFEQKEYIKAQFRVADAWVTWLDQGAYNDERSDYPIFAQKVAQAVQKGDALGGVLLCGTGAGMAIVANRFGGIYAGLVWNEQTARMAKEHDNVNVLVLPSDFITPEQALEYVLVWFHATFIAGEYQKRLDLIDTI